MAIGSEMSGGVRNVAVSTCVFQGTPRFRDILISNSAARGLKPAGQIVVLKEMPSEGVTLSNVRLQAEKGFKIHNARGIALHDGERSGGAGASTHTSGREVRSMQRILVWLCAAAGLAAQSGEVKLTVAAVQMRSTFDVGENRARIVGTLEKLAAQGVQVAVFPECALIGYHTRPELSVAAADVNAAEAAIAATCRARKIAAVFGSVHHAGGKIYNSAVVFDAAGALVERFGKLMLAGEKWATPGNHIAFFDLAGVPSTVIICHDERYPEFVRLPALAGARVVYYISHESGLKQETKLPGYRAQMMARAVENNIFAVAANAPANPDLTGSHGQSRIIGPDGNVRLEAGYFSEETLVETLTVRPAKLTRPLEGVTGEWWRKGLADMLANRHRKLGEP